MRCLPRASAPKTTNHVEKPLKTFQSEVIPNPEPNRYENITYFPAVNKFVIPVINEYGRGQYLCFDTLADAITARDAMKFNSKRGWYETR